MAVLTTGDLTIPTQVFDPWVSTIHRGSVISLLSGATPMQFGKGEAFTFDIGEAEYVGEGQQKGSSDLTAKSQTFDPFKFHKTVRWTEEVMWADEDHQLGVVSQILAMIQPALSRALDFGVIHGINPATGDVVTAMDQRLADTANTVEYDSTAPVYHVSDASIAKILGAGGVPTGVAFDPTLAASISADRDTTGRKIYPDFSFGNELSVFEGLQSATSRTVGAKGVATVDTNLLGVVGDYSAIRWGIQKSIGLEVIEYGDPDGNGDLKRNNQIAFRAEVVYGWGIADVDNNFTTITSDGLGEG